jgi:hypothetical protein
MREYRLTLSFTIEAPDDVDARTQGRVLHSRLAAAAGSAVTAVKLQHMVYMRPPRRVSFSPVLRVPEATEEIALKE